MWLNLKWVRSSLIDFFVSQQLALSTFTERGPQFSNKDSRPGPVIEKAKNFLLCNNFLSNCTWGSTYYRPMQSSCATLSL